jgi:hypothetical protein
MPRSAVRPPRVLPLLSLLLLLGCLPMPVFAQEGRGDDRRGEPRAEASERRERGPERGPERVRPMSPEHVSAAIEVLRRIDPEAAERLAREAEERPQHVAAELRRRFPRVEWFLRLKEYDPPMFELRVEDMRLGHQTSRLARRLREAERTRDAADDPRDPDDARTLRAELRKQLREHFEVRQQIRRRELEDLQRRIERMQADLEQRADDRADLIEQRMRQLTSDDPPTDW